MGNLRVCRLEIPGKCENLNQLNFIKHYSEFRSIQIWSWVYLVQRQSMGIILLDLFRIK